MSNNIVKVTQTAGNKVSVQEANFTVSLAEETVKVVNVGTVISTGFDKNYVHDQNSPSASWTITHNLDKKPAVSVVDSAGTLIICDVQYDSNNQVTLTFDSSTSGKAYFN
jgi:hypothetical protein